MVNGRINPLLGITTLNKLYAGKKANIRRYVGGSYYSKNTVCDNGDLGCDTRHLS